ncbi:curli assembly protein CsgF [Actimicrobium sp. CCI2.3]|uniref:curli assembly protein CsgF n=1 Tax=Actimicrobium sp. CCI2.3 TaxID=3048616 RepID=UPI002AB3F4FB|nr:curli assembly protein CsgF [Actimicrobium sp. CCI2.3]MDY7574740.1 curli assembly protein CsgF [Actimicrobium sp. CCI2.3]MEB0020299.1 curli assembly protein CsgF [Actimicrobium sp. CCI2.3]
MISLKKLLRFSLVVPVALLSCAGAGATELVYTPVNPSFGGNPNNAPGLLAAAQAQNGFKAPTNSPLQNFNNTLQSAILNRLSTDAVNTLFGRSNPLTPGTYDTASYTINIADTGGGNLTIQTTDKSSGATAIFTVSSGALAQ